ncbi:MAG: M20 family metallo-hydrolase [Bacteroidota bacterium]|nr:M20 family metallo-hydrolase [Candidatus Kapabacteria bacterium]MDW8219092.1 M20 family metallo-hydrolase [Bacteroidota bacterium]
MKRLHTSALAELFHDAIQLLRALIATPSPSREEHATATLIQEFFDVRSIPTERYCNNVWSYNRYYDASKPTLLLNSHHDTVKPVQGWTRSPFDPCIEDTPSGKVLFGLGSNDAGAALVSLIAAFVHFYHCEELPFNLILAASAEEEIIGNNGVEALLPHLGSIAAAIVGEPTNCAMAVAEKGLLVLDCTAHGVAGHAARTTGVNAIDKALRNILWFHSFRFPRVSEQLGPITMTVTVINAGTQHNVIPDRCTFVVDVRTTDAYTHEEIIAIIRSHVDCDVQPRSVRLRPSCIPLNHPLVQAAQQLSIPTFASATLSDQAVMPFPSVKIGPGNSERSHTADEHIYLAEIEHGIATYIHLLNTLCTLGRLSA